MQKDSFVKIGFIGLGIMGSRMAANLQKRGHSLVVHNRTREKAEPLLANGAQWADSPAALAAEAEVIFTMLAHPDAVKEVALGRDGFLLHFGRGHLWMDCSSVNPSFSREMAAEAQKRGVHFLDAPVTGSKEAAAGGRLIFWVGGEQLDVDACRPLLECMGNRIVAAGEAGMGASLKMVVNQLLGTFMAATAEGLAFGQSLGLSREVLFEAIFNGPITAPFLAAKEKRIKGGDYDDADFPLRWQHKDLHLASVSAYETGTAMPLLNITKEIYQFAVQDGNGEKDFSAICGYLANRATHVTRKKRNTTDIGNMKTKQLGNSDLFITPVGFGSWAIGGAGWEFAWGKQNDDESIAAIQRALELGINWIDTAAVYGVGHSEEVVARALATWSGKRPYVFTKCGLRWDKEGQTYRDMTAASIRRECEDSLCRLKVDSIDLYQIHWPAEKTAELQEGWSTMAQLQREGKVRWIGLSNFNVKQMELARAIAPITSLQPPYSLIHPEVEEEILPYCHQREIGVIVYSPMASGLLTGAMTRERIAKMPNDDWRKHHPDFNEPKLTANLDLVERLRVIGERRACSVGAVAVAWTLRHPAVTGAIVGARKPEQVNDMASIGGIQLTSADLRDIESLAEAA